MRLPALRATAGIAAALSIVALLCTCVSARASSYTVWSCRGPDGKPLGSQAWRAGDAGDATQDTCAAGGSLRARLLPSDSEPGAVRGFRFALPAGAVVSGYRVHLYATTAKALNEWALSAGLDDDAALGFGEVDAGCPGSGCTFGTLDQPLADGNLAQAADLKSAGLVLGVRCAGWLSCSWPVDDAARVGGETPLAETQLFRAQVDVRDDDGPVPGTPSGSLVAGGALTGAASVSFDARDGGGGVAAVALLIDGAQVARKDAGGSCIEPYVDPVPCPAQLSATLGADLSALSAGTHEARLRAVDAAGNVTTGEPIAFTVGSPPGPPPPPPPSGTGGERVVERIVAVRVPVAPQPVTIDADADRVDLTRDAVVRGIVKDAAGQPLAGATVIVRSRPFGVRRAKLRAERTLTTGADGRFSMPGGVTSRLLVLDVDDSSHRARDQAEVELLHALQVSAVVRDRSLRNGSRMTLRAEVDGAGGGAADKVVLVQAIVGGRWATVESLTSDADGEAVWRYRFRGTKRRAIYSFRVRVERTGDVWPWATTTSDVVRVEVRP